jgi:hypothetical protein
MKLLKLNQLFDRILSAHSQKVVYFNYENEGVPDKVIMSYTGHKSMKLFNNYYRPNQDHRINLMNNV